MAFGIIDISEHYCVVGIRNARHLGIKSKTLGDKYGRRYLDVGRGSAKVSIFKF